MGFYSFRITIVTMLFISLVANTLGIYLLNEIKNKKKTQKILLSFLSGCTAVISLIEIVYWSSELGGLVEDESRYLQVLSIIDLGLFGTYYMTLLILTLDRLFAFAYPFKYQYVFSSRKVTIALSLCWVIGLASSIPFFFIEYHSTYTIYYKYIILSFDAITIVTVFTTYAFILLQLLKRRRTNKKLSMASTASSNTIKENSRFLVVFFLIVTSFLLFVVIPDIVFVYRQVIKGLWDNTTEVETIYCVWIINYILDPLIYFFFQKDVRMVLEYKFRTLFGLEIRRPEESRTESYIDFTPTTDRKNICVIENKTVA